MAHVPSIVRRYELITWLLEAVTFMYAFIPMHLGLYFVVLLWGLAYGIFSWSANYYVLQKVAKLRSPEIGVESWRVHAKDRLQVAICEPVEVDDDGDIFGRQRINGILRIFVR